MRKLMISASKHTPAQLTAILELMRTAQMSTLEFDPDKDVLKLDDEHALLCKSFLAHELSMSILIGSFLPVSWYVSHLTILLTLSLLLITVTIDPGRGKHRFKGFQRQRFLKDFFKNKGVVGLPQ